MNDSGSKGHVLFEEAEAALPLLKCCSREDVQSGEAWEQLCGPSFLHCGGSWGLGGKVPEVNMKLSRSPIISLDCAYFSNGAHTVNHNIIVITEMAWGTPGELDGHLCDHVQVGCLRKT